ncbi:tRNA (adenosine(37)-N6)-dimethylallyltransferase MiaA [Wielerella bovis]|uniref:tRNA (adenosine(37)-N6)-dimethylallyltransferase MiaA n=1 Tax=Wielerella bovis TaxID=2917790 RepID=UPI002019D502|nr:tRNA (adenosine(37)-N6)-dimethylallyltransferase MiaA [Wielerella bovis]MCG7656639.1 tRNA (adenosine(37)-N6)-dimethylallyltransferase MiaA [Wielerella bovis]MCG7658864.1 tRNA (adenosine(37)-N6)-dimethylallyltransferase MiaA [Wielerella bovis]
MSQHRPKAFAILGATASGKTALALHLAKKFPCEIISLDSALVYRDMNIGTAKPTPDELAIAPHHLIDIISPMQTYSAAEFVDDCVRLVNEIHARGHLPLIVGGTMMYFHALTQGLNALPEADTATREILQQQKSEHGLAYLYQQLQQHDPETAARLEPADSQRIERALEVWLLTGKPLSQHFAEQETQAAPLDLHTLTLIPADRSLLHEQINKRFNLMIEQGFLDEIRDLRQKYPQLQPEMPSMRCVGYRQAWAHLNGETTLDECVAQGQAATRQLAKRQLTWLRKLPADTVLDPFLQRDYLAAATIAMQYFFDI